MDMDFGYSGASKANDADSANKNDNNDVTNLDTGKIEHDKDGVPPDNLDDSTGGSHNGSEYLAYTFFVENVGDEITSYWSELFITDVIKKIDSAVRIRVYRNGQPVTYAKKASNGRNEPDTIPFEEEKLVARNKVDNFKPGDIDKYTIVIWVEGSDPECTDDILGGEFSVYMDFNSEYVEN